MRPPAPARRGWLRNREDWAALALPSLMFLGGFLHFLLSHDYNLFAPEALLALGLVFGTSLLLGLLLVAIRSQSVRVAAIGLLLIVFFDIQFEIISTIAKSETIGDSKLAPFLILFGAMIGLAAVVTLLRKHLSTILATGFAVFLVSTILLPPRPVFYGPQHLESMVPSPQDLPPIIHLVLDGHIGVEGIPQDIHGGSELRQELIDFYLSYGFRLYGSAYSQYFLTRLSLRALFNPKPPSNGARLTHLGGNRWILEENQYFDTLIERGYLVRVHQTEYMDFCSRVPKALEYCFKYPASSPRLLGNLEASIPGKSSLLIYPYVDRSSLLFSLMSNYDSAVSALAESGFDLISPRSRRTHSFFSLGTLDIIDQLTEEIADNPKGRIHFAHLMMPHGPYILASDCSLKADVEEWLDRRLDHHNLNSIGTADHREAAYGGYIAQTRCLMKSLSRIFEALKRAGKWEDATVILHGDHGSRITIRDPIEQHLDAMTARDMVDSYSTLYAIRTPGLAPGYDLNMVSVQELFGEQMLNIDREAKQPSVSSAPSSHAPMRWFEMAPINPQGSEAAAEN